MNKNLIKKIIETIIGVILIFVGIGLMCGIIELFFDILKTISHYISDIGLYAAIIVTGVYILKKLFNVDVIDKIKNKIS